MEDDETPTIHRATCRLGILIVDDDPAIRELLNFAMRMAGFDVHLAPDGLAAARVYRLFRKQIDIVLLDVQMPFWDGPRTLAQLQQLSPDLRCCFMSGDLGIYTQESLRDLGALMVFQKPLSAAALARTLMDLALAGQASDQPAAEEAVPNS
jgi:DNA-binding NtrC family response regulator